MPLRCCKLKLKNSITILQEKMENINVEEGKCITENGVSGNSLES